MKDHLKVTLRAFIYFFLVIGSCLGIGFSIASGKIVEGLILGFLGGVGVSAIMTTYLLIGLIFFQKKVLFYKDMPEQLLQLGIKNIFHESVAGNASGAIIRYGGLFLTDVSLLFLPHKFARNTMITQVPLQEIKKAKKLA